MSRSQFTMTAAAAADARAIRDDLRGAAATVAAKRDATMAERGCGAKFQMARTAIAASDYHNASINMDLNIGRFFDSPATTAAAAINVAACYQWKALDALSARSGVAGRDPDNCDACNRLKNEAAAIGADVFYPIPGTPDRDAAALELFKTGKRDAARLTAIGVADVDADAACNFSL